MPDVTITVPAALVGEVANLLGREAQRLLHVRATDERTDPTPDKSWHAELWDVAKGLNLLRNALLAAAPVGPSAESDRSLPDA